MAEAQEAWEPIGQREYAQAQLACMQERGWEGELIGSDEIQFEGYPSSQQDQFNADNEECFASAADVMPPSVPLSTALLELNHQRVVAAGECLLDNGYPVEPVPSFQTWRDLLESNADYSVTLLARQAERNGGKAYGDIEDACPDPDPFFYDPVTEIYSGQVDYAAYHAAGEG
ncbi:MAG: hypothetical protein LBK95_02545 [Bifidobacteriaceae bacterium]|jgi:hypothetical protein|nr:hypothetical protein [Bifidobacteriaceae bacterium]